MYDWMEDGIGWECVLKDKNKEFELKAVEWGKIKIKHSKGIRMYFNFSIENKWTKRKK
jgi:hypothetical protein